MQPGASTALFSSVCPRDRPVRHVRMSVKLQLPRFTPGSDTVDKNCVTLPHLCPKW